jgi:hypothetical protein
MPLLLAVYSNVRFRVTQFWEFESYSGLDSCIAEIAMYIADALVL